MKHYLDEVTFSDMIIGFLFSSRSLGSYRKIIYERVNDRKKLSKTSFNRKLHYLKSKNLIQYDKENVSLSDKGKLFYKNNTQFKNKFNKPKKEHEVILIFDIPESKRKVRNWLRNQLKDWDFTMIQMSVWRGDGPVSQEFLDHVALLGIKKCVKIFKIQK
ncbi:MAG: CRISPR-associated endonuclease Cas2 [Candidatus Pacebacteria bacterium]|nr:CRISPR-associated endonuclease Cas2 [Candidatus Paceibacterota bacterium]